MSALSFTSLHRIWRYYAVGIINTIFGYGIYSLLIYVGLTMYMAQAVGHIIGVSFNYFSYSRHVFRSTPSSKPRFIISYTLNYFIGVAILAVTAHIFSSPYIAGLSTMLIASFVNFFILRRFVFIDEKSLA